MVERIRMMIVDDNLEMRENLRKLLELEGDFETVAEAETGEDAIRKAKLVLPDVILMDINLPGMDGIKTTEIIVNQVPRSLVVMISVQGEQEYFRRAMLAGAKDYLIKPCQGEKLLRCIRNIYARQQEKKDVFIPLPSKSALGKVVTVFSTKGGVGKTTIATNLATALSFNKKSKICIVDLDLQFGDVAVFLNLVLSRTIANVITEVDVLDGKDLEKNMTLYRDNMHVLATPLRPEQADDISAEDVRRIINEMRHHYDYIIIDTAGVFNDAVFNVFDQSDLIMMIISQDFPALKNTVVCLETLDSLDYPQEEIKIILNRANDFGGVSIKNSEELLKRNTLAYLSSAGKTAVASANHGIPFVVNQPGTLIAKGVSKVADYVMGNDKDDTNTRPRSKVGSLINSLQYFRMET
jgi:pilus assembly protein CpaE